MSKSGRVMQGGHAPLNAEAARVTHAGIAYEPSFYMHKAARDQREMPPIRRPQDVREHLRPLIGFSYARLTVIGLSAADESVWIVRCRCGMFSSRHFSDVVNLAMDQDCCVRCNAELLIRRNELSRRLGREIEKSEVPGACPPRGPLPAGVVLTKKEKIRLRAKEAKQEERRAMAEINKRQSGTLRHRRVFAAPEGSPTAMSLAFAKAKD